MNKVLAMFPGQGSQYPGMAKDILAQFPYTKQIFERANDTLKLDVLALCTIASEEELKLTTNTQPCLLTQSIAVWTVIQNEKGFNADGYAGHSLGEYSALVASKRLNFEDALRLVRQRGMAMQEAVPVGKGAMSAVLGSDQKSLEDLCKAISSKISPVEIANYNSPQQLVLAGALEAVGKVESQLTEKGIKFLRLPVSAPFHSILMQPARSAMELPLREIRLNSQNTDFIPNITGEMINDYRVDYLVNQIDSPVKWIQSIESCVQNGYSEFIEIGPGRVLQGLVKRIVPKDRSFKIFGTDPLRTFLEK